MATGLGLLGFAPGAFWSLTPRELEAAVRGRLGLQRPQSGLQRRDLESLMCAYPDSDVKIGVAR